MIDFQGQVAIVTGGGRGIGRSHALDLARRGAAVVVNDLGARTVAGEGRDAAVAEVVVREIEAAGGRALADGGDVSDPEACEALVARTVERFGRVDILVANAGNQRFLRFAETELADYESLISIHLGGSYHMARASWPRMAAQGYGRIVLTTSQVGFYGQVDAVVYGAAKGGILGLMHGMKLDAPAVGIGVNCISPFAVTRISEDLFPRELAQDLAPEHVTAGVTFLASRGCTLNGEVLIAGGGHFAVARTIETLGIDVADPAFITAETVADRIGEITDLGRTGLYPDALAAVQVTFDRLAEQARHRPQTA
jgi:NAD(P)-dependent dehydrogenase (short-subunit alcohol dehydrogenase family)